MRRSRVTLAAIAAVSVLGSGGVAQAATVDPDSAVTGYQLVLGTSPTAEPGTQITASVSCPANTLIVWGGVISHADLLNVNINSTFPSSASTWTLYLNNASSYETNYNTFVVCVAKSRNYSVVTGPTALNPAGQQSAVGVRCPAHSSPLGGGVESSSTSTAVNVSSEFPTKHGWFAYVNNASSTGAFVTAYVVCGKKFRGYEMVAGPITDNPVGRQTLASSDCSGNHVWLSGGGYATSSSTLVNMNSTGLFGFVENNASAADNELVSYGICAEARGS